MKKLQNNFTTIEQSKRLLELGVPEWTADCYDFKNDGIINKEAGILEICDIPLDLDNAIPCWSVGRLIEIYCLATGVEYTKIGISEISLTELMIKMIEIAVKVKTFDFSKLEE